MLVAIVETLREYRREKGTDGFVFGVWVYIYWVLWCLSVRCEWNCGRWIFMMMMMMRIFCLKFVEVWVFLFELELKDRDERLSHCRFSSHESHDTFLLCMCQSLVTEQNYLLPRFFMFKQIRNNHIF